MAFVDDALELPEPSFQCVLHVETRLSDEVLIRYPARPVGAQWQSRFPAETVENQKSEIPIARAEGDMQLSNVEVTAIAITAGEPSVRCEYFWRTRDTVPRPQRP